MKKILVFLLSFGILSSALVGASFATFAVADYADPFGSKISVKVPTTRHYIETKSWFNSGDPSEHVYVYAFKETAYGTRKNAAFPGLEATYQKDIDNTKKLFYYDIPVTFDTFIVSKVVSGTAVYQTENIVISSLSGDNCVYLDADSGSDSIPVGHYDYVLGLSSNSATIISGSSTQVTIDNSIGNISYSVSPADSATVTINNSIATITSEVIGASTITFSDESSSTPVTFTLTVQESGVVSRHYIETKSWFNNGGENEHVYFYAFKNGATGVENAPFPGNKATWLKNLEDGKKLFYFDVSETFDTFVVSRVVNDVAVYQTVDIDVSSLSGDNCIYLNAESGSSAIPVGHYNFALRLSENNGTIASGGSTSITFDRNLANVSATVSPSGATVSVDNQNNSASITSSTVGSYTITFSDGVNQANYTLTVNAYLNVTYTITSFPDWIPNDGAKAFAWTWGGGSGSGSWVEITLSYSGSNNSYYNVSGTFTAPNNITGFNMVRCSSSTTAPNWSATGDSSGRIYNKTSDITVSSGVYSYTSPTFEGYNP